MTPAGLSIAAQGTAFSSFENYNSFNGYLTASLPLHHIGGRGTAGFDLVWNLQPGWTANHAFPQLGTVAVDPYPASNNIAAGAANYYGLSGPGFVYSRTGASWTACSGGGYSLGGTLTTIIFVEPNGSQVSLTDIATGGAVKPPPHAPSNPCPVVQPASWDAGRGTAFRSTDGSQIQFDASSNVLEQNLTNGGYGVNGLINGTLIFPTGVQYTITNSVVKYIKDPNGNQITLNYANFSNLQLPIDWYVNVPLLTSVQDSLNRVTTIDYADSTCGGCLSITYPGAAGSKYKVEVQTGSLSANLRSGSSYALMGIGSLFNSSGQPTSPTYNPTVASAVLLPDGSQYSFAYNPYGELARVVLPTGGAYEYDYSGMGSNGGYLTAMTGGGVMIYRRLSERREYVLGGTGTTFSARTDYAAATAGANTTDTQTLYDASGNVVRTVVNTMSGSPEDALSMSGTSCNTGIEGLETQTQNATLQVTYKYPASSGCMNNPHLSSVVTKLDSMSSETDYLAYDAYGNVTDEKDYDWCSSGGCLGSLLREITTTYEASVNSNYAGSGNNANNTYNYNLIRLPAHRETLNASGTQIAQSYWFYDQQSLQPANGILNHDNVNYGASATLRGNATSVYQWLNTPGTPVIYFGDAYIYDIAGNVTLHQYPTNNNIQYSYNDDLTNQYAFPTTTTLPSVNRVANVTKSTYDYGSGTPLVVTDANGKQTSYTNADPYGRVTKITDPTGGHTFVLYALPHWTITTRDQTIANDAASRSEMVYDGFGRPAETRQYVDSNDLIAVDYEYDAMGNENLYTNPTKIVVSTWTPDGFGYSTNVGYDALGRVINVNTPDGAVTYTTYSGNTTTVIDPTSVQTATTTDALGRATSVVEDVTGLNFATQYQYDVLGDLTNVQKCPAGGCANSTSGQVRTFQYDSLGRLTRASNPESGTVNYAYYNSSGPTTTLAKRTDARNSYTAYTYDALNRLSGVAYQDGTPSLGYTYDALGNLTQSVTSSVVNNFTYDADSRPVSSNVQIGGQSYGFTYAYNLGGDLIQESYPSGRAINTSYDIGHRSLNMNGVAGGTTTPYVQQVGYYPQGSLYYWQYGNNVWPVDTYTKLLQPQTQHSTLGNNANQYMFYTQNNWNTNQTMGGGVECYGNQVAPGSMTCISEGYGYDHLRRLTAMAEMFYQGVPGASRSFQYDAFGNMSVVSNSGAPLSGLTPMAGTSPFNAANNQLNYATYDARGAMKTLGTMSFLYDGDVRQTQSVDSSPGGVTVNYTYDAQGQRVQKVAGGVTTVDVHDAFGQLAAEYNSAGVTPACLTCYLSYDSVGSVRMVTDQHGNLLAWHDYLPYGEEVPSGYAGRSGPFGSVTNVYQMFTGQERDPDGTVDVDYFHARHFASILGAFTQPDPMNAGADIGNPQSWNGYGYVLGNPLGLVDPSGMCASSDATPCYPGGTTQTDSNNFGVVGGWAWWMNFGWRTLLPQFPSSGGGGGGDPVFATTVAGKGDVSTAGSPAKTGTRPDWLNNITSIFGYDQRIKLPSCAAIAIRTAADDLNPFLPSAADAAQGALSVGQAMKFNQALTYAAAKGLRYPNKSSVFRNILKTSGTLGKLADALPLANLDYGLFDGLIEEVRAMNRGECQ